MHFQVVCKFLFGGRAHPSQPFFDWSISCPLENCYDIAKWAPFNLGATHRWQLTFCSMPEVSGKEIDTDKIKHQMTSYVQ